MNPVATPDPSYSSSSMATENDALFLPYLNSSLEELYGVVPNPKKARQAAKLCKTKSKVSQSKVRKCNKCPYTTSHAGDFQRHVRRHAKSCLSCSECNMPFMTLGHLNGHKRAVHQIGLLPGDKNWKCNLCDYTTRHSSDIHRHRKRHKSAPISCNICNRPFYFSNMLDRHLKRVHRNADDPQANVDGADNVKTPKRTINTQECNNIINCALRKSNINEECLNSCAETDTLLSDQIKKLNQDVIDLRRKRSEAKQRKLNSKKIKEVSYDDKDGNNAETRSKIGGFANQHNKILSNRVHQGDIHETHRKHIYCAFCRYRAITYKDLQEHLDDHDIDELSDTGDKDIEYADIESDVDDPVHSESESTESSLLSETVFGNIDRTTMAYETENSNISESIEFPRGKDIPDIANDLELSDTDSDSSAGGEECFADIVEQAVSSNDEINAEKEYLDASDMKNNNEREYLELEDAESDEASETESVCINAEEFKDAVALWNGFIAKLEFRAKDTFPMQPFACSKCSFATSNLDYLKIHVEAHLCKLRGGEIV